MMEKQCTLKEAKIQKVNKVLYEWFLTKCAKGYPVTTLLIIRKVEHFHEQMKLKQAWEFSIGWLKKFKKGQGIRTLMLVVKKIS